MCTLLKILHIHLHSIMFYNYHILQNMCKLLPLLVNQRKREETIANLQISLEDVVPDTETREKTSLHTRHTAEII